MLITLKNGENISVEIGITLFDLARKLSNNLAQEALVAKVNGNLKDLTTTLIQECTVEFFTFDDEEGKKALRHTAAHILAQAIKRLYLNVRLAIGSAIENGFYYDFDIETISNEDLLKIETEMQYIVEENFPIKRLVLSKIEALKLLEKKQETYKLELLSELEENIEISFYKQGEFIDLCTGPHIISTGQARAFKLLNVAGAYWRGNEKNKMLQRIYGTAFIKKQDLDEYVIRLKEVKLRDHNRLGRELELFTTVAPIGQGLPLLMPKGAKIIQILQRLVEDEEEKRGYLLTKTPLMAKSDLYKISGHWTNYSEGMFIIGNEKRPEEVLALRPMTCPFQFMIFKSKTRSYKDLPMKYNETSTLFRNEASGEMHGLARIRQFTLSEGHVICTPEQLEDEFRAVLNLIDYFMVVLDLKKDLTYRFSKWDPNLKKKYIGETHQWEDVENKMREILEHVDLPYVEAIGEAAFYGPKLDVQIKNVYGKEDTLITVQIDFALAKRFDMTYVDKNGSKQYPYVVHRTSIGCYERTLALLIEKYAGAFPVWLAPVQIKVMPITDRSLEYAKKIIKELKICGIRVELDDREVKISYKIRQAEVERIPYIIILGDKEIKKNTLAIRQRNKGDIGAMGINDFISKIQADINGKVNF